MADYLVGEVVRLQARIVDIEQKDVDPGEVTLKVKSPDDVVTTYLSSIGEVMRSAAGNYYIDLELTSSGIWAWRWESDEPHIGAAEGLLMTQPSMIA